MCTEGAYINANSDETKQSCVVGEPLNVVFIVNVDILFMRSNQRH